MKCTKVQLSENFEKYEVYKIFTRFWDMFCKKTERFLVDFLVLYV